MARSSYMMILTLLLVIPRLPNTSGQQQLFKYQFFRLVLIWGPSFCRVENCNRRTPTPIFTLHGLWPDNQTRILCNCPGTAFMPFQGQAFVNRVDQDWFDFKLRNTPNVSRPAEQSFWNHEWTRHGTCSEATFKQLGYFNLAVDLANTYGRLIQQEILRKVVFPAPSNDVVNAIRGVIKQRQPEVRCARNRREPGRQLLLKEVVICFDPMGKEIINCPTRTNVCQSCTTDSTCETCSTSTINMPQTF